MNVSDSQARFIRWGLTLSSFDYPVHYRPFLQNKVSDALSRCTRDDPKETSELEGLLTLDDPNLSKKPVRNGIGTLEANESGRDQRSTPHLQRG